MRYFKYRLTFLSYGLFIFYLKYTNSLSKFIAPHLEWLTYAAAFLFGLFLFLTVRYDHRGCSCEQHSPKRSNIWKEIGTGVLLISPVVLFFVVKPPDILKINMPTVNTVSNKESTLQSDQVSTLPRDTDGYVNLDLLQILTLVRDSPRLVQKYRFKTMGMISSVSEDRISIQRVLIYCCIADAMAAEMSVMTKSTKEFSKGNWVELKGAVEVKGKTIFVADSIRIIKKPSDPYIYVMESLEDLEAQLRKAKN